MPRTQVFYHCPMCGTSKPPASFHIDAEGHHGQPHALYVAYCVSGVPTGKSRVVWTKKPMLRDDLIAFRDRLTACLAQVEAALSQDS